MFERGLSIREGAECSRAQVGQGARGAMCSRGLSALGGQVLKSDRVL